MSPTLGTLLDRGRQYVLASERLLDDARLPPEERIRRLVQLFRDHSTVMKDVSLDDAQALLACVVGAVKWAERHSNSGYLSDALSPLEDAESLLRSHFIEEDEPGLPLNLPYTRSARAMEYV